MTESIEVQQFWMNKVNCCQVLEAFGLFGMHFIKK